MENRYVYKAKTTPKEKGEFNNVWAIGNLIVSNGKYYIHPVGNIVNVKNEIGRIIVMHEVIPDTICQCTGLKDKNGKLIWENDIVKRTDKPKAGEPTIGIIEHDIANTAFLIRWIDNPNYSPTFPWKEKIEVIGNKFDNKDLLEKEFFE